MGNSMNKAVFVDRDGTLNEMVYDEAHGLFDSPRRPEQVRAVPFAGRFLRDLRALGYRIIVVTNQPGIAKGTLKLAQLHAVNKRLLELLSHEDGTWDDLRFCPHHPEGGPGAKSKYVTACECRKPKPGLLVAAARDHGLDLERSWMVGDGLVDVQAGRAAGCRTILVTRLKIEQVERLFAAGIRKIGSVAQDLTEARRLISQYRERR